MQKLILCTSFILLGVSSLTSQNLNITSPVVDVASHGEDANLYAIICVKLNITMTELHNGLQSGEITILELKKGVYQVQAGGITIQILIESGRH